MQLHENEETQFEISANLRKGIEYVGGLLTITNEKLFFKPHAMNIQKKDVSIQLKEVENAEKVNILGMAPNGIKVSLHDGTSYTFVIGLPWMKDREQIIQYICENAA